MGKITLYTGCYTPEAGDKGILLFEMDTLTGRLAPMGSVAVQNPSFLQLHGDALYAACEEGDTGRVAAFSLAGGKETPLGQLDAPGKHTCHLAVWPDGSHVTLANYTSGSLFTASLAPGGAPEAVCETVQLEGHGPDPERQDGPHAHAVYFAPNSPAFVACDLGSDRLYVYTTAPDGRLTPNMAQPVVELHPGAGPRHMSFHPEGRYAYLICELSCEVVVFDFIASTGIFSQKQVVSTLSGRRDGDTAAEIALSPDGRFLYASTRGEDAIAVWAVSPTDGTLTPVGNYASAGKGPRHFMLTPDGRFVVVANENTGNLAVIRRNLENGQLEEVVDIAEAPHAVCVICANGKETP